MQYALCGKTQVILICILKNTSEAYNARQRYLINWQIYIAFATLVLEETPMSLIEVLFYYISDFQVYFRQFNFISMQTQMQH